MVLKDGTEVQDRRLGRIKQFDERSRSFNVKELVDDKPLRSYTWRIKERLDQLDTPACVGFSWAQELVSRPKEVLGLNSEFAYTKVYRAAQQLDDFPGGNYEGTSVLAGAKAIQTLGFMKSYHWAFSFQDALRSIGYMGPGVLGIDWYESMFEADSDGFLKVEGEVAGGHAILVRGINLKDKYVLLANSWGASFGIGGDCKLRFDDFERLLGEDGEYVTPVGRLKPLGY